MKRITLHRLFPLIITLALGLVLTAFYITKNTTNNAQCIDLKNSNAERKARNEFIMFQALSRHLLSLHN